MQQPVPRETECVDFDLGWRGAENQAFLVESVTGVETLKAMAVEPQMQRRWEEQLAGYGMEAWGHAQFISWPLGSLLVDSVPRVLSPDLSSALSRVMASCAYRLIAHRWQVEDKLVNLSPGMAVTVEIKTGSRRIISYLLSPVLRYRQETLRER